MPKRLEWTNEEIKDIIDLYCNKNWNMMDIKNKRLASIVADLGMLTAIVSSHSNNTSLNGFGISICRIYSFG